MSNPLSDTWLSNQDEEFYLRSPGLQCRHHSDIEVAHTIDSDPRRRLAAILSIRCADLGGIGQGIPRTRQPPTSDTEMRLDPESICDVIGSDKAWHPAGRNRVNGRGVGCREKRHQRAPRQRPPQTFLAHCPRRRARPALSLRHPDASHARYAPTVARP